MPSLLQVAVPAGTTAQITSEHKLRLAVPPLRCREKPTLRGWAIDRNVVASAVHRTQGKHGAAMSACCGLLAPFEGGRGILRAAATIHEHFCQRDLGVHNPP